MNLVKLLALNMAVFVCAQGVAQTKNKKSSLVSKKKPAVAMELKDAWVHRLRSTEIDVIRFKETPILKAVEFVESKCPTVRIFGKELLGDSEIKIDWETEEIDCVNALKEILLLADLRLKTDSKGIHIIPKATPEELMRDMRVIILPDVEFVDTPLADALAFLQQRSVEVSPEKPDVVGATVRGDRSITGLSFILPDPKPRPNISGLKKMQSEEKSGGAALAPASESGGGFDDDFGDPSENAEEKGGPGNVRITLRLRNVPLYEALRHACALAELYPVFEDSGLVLVPMNDPGAKEKFEAQNKAYKGLSSGGKNK